ncbi:hypothetical protein [Streptomyces sp. NBC_01481]|uniref:hypothetical protein n=1 Tax=Streptomyces sp. NBC_01481 TaxID=2975869 RepID=UPI00225A7E52|nr:hypothetical protein [Streptomyces sp. NBC_01481]MCX4587797.1 hypothetical protein [Streptomyces sp. NBC_01481]
MTSASRICDGTLDKSAAEALQRIGGKGEFSELTGTTDTGEPNKFSIERASAHLHDEVDQRSRCTVYKADDKSGHPLIQVDFKASNDHPNRSEVEKGDSRGITFYPVGVYASTKQGYSTSLSFRCQTKNAKGKNQFINAGMFSSADQLEGKSTSMDRMTILNSVSRRLAAKLGCQGEAQLPAKVPAPQAP